ncbi:hypothetical protein ACQP0C_02435 [Nocardia sp. CA-129566]|uniref:hypothetical protein n=1 Tax=Nocardia sp. CA-129566 TaxID=3239976 RepID=UPI003D959247
MLKDATAFAGVGQQVLGSGCSSLAADGLAGEVQRAPDRGDAHALGEQCMDLVVALPGGLAVQSWYPGPFLWCRMSGFEGLSSLPRSSRILEFG